METRRTWPPDSTQRSPAPAPPRAGSAPRWQSQVGGDLGALGTLRREPAIAYPTSAEVCPPDAAVETNLLPRNMDRDTSVRIGPKWIVAELALYAGTELLDVGTSV